MLFKTFGNLGLLCVLIVVINGINQIDAKEFINEEFGIKFDYPDEWELTTANENLSSFHVKYDDILLANFHADPDPNIFNFVSLTAYTNWCNFLHIGSII